LIMLAAANSYPPLLLSPMMEAAAINFGSSPWRMEKV
jgi:hypothetical protein